MSSRWRSWVTQGAPKFWDEELVWIGAQVLAPIWRAGVQFPLVEAPQGFHGGDEGIVPFIATAESPIRFRSEDALREFSGVMGHQHAPRPDKNWDPGRMNVARILEGCQMALGVSPKPKTGPAPTPVVAGQLSWPHLDRTSRDQFPVHTRIIQQVCAAEVDGDYYIKTAIQVRSFQNAHGLDVTGAVDGTTGTAIVQNVCATTGSTPAISTGTSALKPPPRWLRSSRPMASLLTGTSKGRRPTPSGS